MRIRLFVSGFSRWNEMSWLRVVALKSATGQLTSDSRRLPCQTGRVGRFRTVPGSFSFDGFEWLFAREVDFFFAFAMPTGAPHPAEQVSPARRLQAGGVASDEE